MNKVVGAIREELKPHHVDGFAAMCFPMPTFQQMERLIGEIERLSHLVNQRDAQCLALSLKADSWETAAGNAKKALSSSRSDAIEEAARVCEGRKRRFTENRENLDFIIAKVAADESGYCAAAIRSLSSTDQGEGERR